MNTKTTNRRRTALLLASSLGLTAALAACGTSTPDATVTPLAQQASSTTIATSDDDDTRPASTSQPSGTAQPQPSATSTAALLASVTVTPEDAARTAVATAASSRVVGIELDREQGTVAWDVDVVTNDRKREIIVDAKTGAVLANRVDDDDSDDVADDGRLLDAARVDHAGALQKAVAEVPDGRVVDLDLDEDDGTIEWDVDVIAPDRVKHELTINAVSGAVIKHETD